MSNKKRVLPPKPKVVEEDPPPRNKKKEPKIEPKIRAPRKRPTIEDHISNYNQLFDLLNAEIERKSREQEKGVRSLRKVRKRLLQMRKEVPYITRSKAARKYASMRKIPENGGINLPLSISKELRNFLEVEKGLKLSRLDVMRAICVYCHFKDGETRENMLRWKYLNPKGKRNLQNKDNGQIIEPDTKLSKLLNYEKYKKDVANRKVKRIVKDKNTGSKKSVPVKDDALYYCTIQKLITPHLNATK